MAKALQITCLSCRFAQRLLIFRHVQILEFPAHLSSTALATPPPTPHFTARSWPCSLQGQLIAHTDS